MSAGGPQHHTHAPSTSATVALLRMPAAYPEGTRSVESIETHMAWVFLTERHAYKMKKPVRTSYLDFSTLEKRKQDAEREVSLNRRLAPHVYLGVVAVTADTAGTLALQGRGEPVEWLVKMKRLPRDRMLDAAIADGAVEPADVAKVGRLLAGFYQKAPSAPVTAAEYLRRLRSEIEDSASTLSDPSYELDRGTTARIHDALRAQAHEHGASLRARVAQGLVVEGHGDLRPEHVCLLDPPVIIDCLEFNQTLRWLDVLSELAYLALECRRLGAEWIGRQVLDTYGRRADDPYSASLCRFFCAYHACIRAKIAVWHLEDDGVGDPRHWVDKARHYLRLAEEMLANA